MIIKNGKIALRDCDEFASLDIEINQGKIVSIGENLHGSEILNADGMQIFPGAIDPHVHFDEPGFTDREDFYHGSCAAVSGGVTTIIDMPGTSIPPVTNLKNLRAKLDTVKNRAIVDFGFFGGVSGQVMETEYQKNMAELAAYVMGFKTYFISGMDSFRSLSLDQIMKVLSEAKKLQRPVLLHAEDPSIVNELTETQKALGKDWTNFYRSRPEEAEVFAVIKAIAAVRATGAQLHIVHVGSGEAAKLLSGTPNISGETAPHYLAFNNKDLERLGGALKTTPVVKSEGNSEILWECLAKGVLDFAASDHAPAPASQKNTGSAWDDYSGIPGTGTLFPYLYSEGLIKRKIPLSRFLEIISENAAKRYGFWNKKGSIDVGKDADLIFVDPNENWQVKGKNFFSKGKITPFENMIFQGKIEKTMIRGKVIFDSNAGIKAKPGYGQFIKPHSSTNIVNH
ncbi:MAG: amidohydrolase family protein [Candidatus Marinimicrobia bacterium]|nr:amidohydrolase family protein [Candidatus Neomarinimicrobiota bacterium]